MHDSEIKFMFFDEIADFPFSKEIAVGPGSNQLEDQRLCNDLIDQQPVRLNMAFAHILIIP